MEDFTRALSKARLIDLQDGSALCLPDHDQMVAVGLTVDDRLSFTVNPHDDDLVLTLCHVQRREDGHWFLPSSFLPCLLNEAPADIECLLSQGSTIRIGDREVRYSIPLESRLRMTSQSTSPGGPPPKPRRTSLNLDEAPHLPKNMSPIAEEAPEYESDVSADTELIQHLSSPEEVAQLACSYVCHQVALYTDLLLSAAELDFLFKAILASGETCKKQLTEFVTRYNEEQANQKEAAGQIWPLHGPVIYLLMELLKENLELADYATLWIKLLATFSNFSPNLPSLIHYQVAPVVLGAMAVHAHAPSLQQYACTVLTQLATYEPPVGQKGPVREGGVDLVTRVLTNHMHETLVLRPALRMLANLTHTYSAVANEALSLGVIDEEDPVMHSGGLPDATHSVVLQEVERSMGILDFIEEHALPVVMETMEHHLRDLAIQTEGRRLLAFFVDEEIKATRKRSLSQLTDQRPKVRFQLDPNDPTSIVATDHDSTDTTDDEADDNSRRMSTTSYVITLDTAPPIGKLHPLPEPAEYDVIEYSPIAGGTLTIANDSPLITIESPTERPMRRVGVYQADEPKVRLDEQGSSSSSSSASLNSSIFEFEPWDEELPVLRSSANVSVKRKADDIADPVVVVAGGLVVAGSDSVGSAEKGGKSLMDELAEIHDGVEDDERQTTIGSYSNTTKEVKDGDIKDKCGDTTKEVKDDVKSPQTTFVSYSNITKDVIDEPTISSFNNTKKEVKDDDKSPQPTFVSYINKDMSTDSKTTPQSENTTTEVTSKEADIPVIDPLYVIAIPEKNEDVSEKEKGNSLKRGMKKLPGRASRMFNKVKQRLKFKELRTKEEQLIESNKVSDNTGDSSPMSTGGIDQSEEVYLIAGATIDASLTEEDKVPANNQSNASLHVGQSETSLHVGQSEAIIHFGQSEAGSHVGQSEAGSHVGQSEAGLHADQSMVEKAPPLFIESAEPEVKGKLNTVGNLINRWKKKETAVPSEKGSVKKISGRKQWRPFEQVENPQPINTLTSVQEHPLDHGLRSEGREMQTNCDGNQSSMTIRAQAERTTQQTQDQDERAEYLAGNSTRRTLGSLALLPDVEHFMTSARPSLTDAAELATWVSSYNARTSENVEDIDQGAEQEVRINRTKWKSVVAELKVKVKDVPRNLGTREIGHVTSGGRSEVRSHPELLKPQYRAANVLAAKALITEHVLKVWQKSPSSVSAMLEERTSDCLSRCGVAPDIILSIRDEFNLTLPINKGHLELTSSLMDMLIGLPSGDETRLEFLDSLHELLSVSAHPYHQQVAAQCGRVLLTDHLTDLCNYPTGVATLQELLDCTQRRLAEINGITENVHQAALVAFQDRLSVCLSQEVWL